MNLQPNEKKMKWTLSPASGSWAPLLEENRMRYESLSRGLRIARSNTVSGSGPVVSGSSSLETTLETVMEHSSEASTRLEEFQEMRQKASELSSMMTQMDKNWKRDLADMDGKENQLTAMLQQEVAELVEERSKQNQEIQRLKARITDLEDRQSKTMDVNQQWKEELIKKVTEAREKSDEMARDLITQRKQWEKREDELIAEMEAQHSFSATQIDEREKRLIEAKATIERMSDEIERMKGQKQGQKHQQQKYVVKGLKGEKSKFSNNQNGEKGQKAGVDERKSFPVEVCTNAAQQRMQRTEQKIQELRQKCGMDTDTTLENKVLPLTQKNLQKFTQSMTPESKPTILAALLGATVPQGSPLPCKYDKQKVLKESAKVSGGSKTTPRSRQGSGFASSSTLLQFMRDP